MALFTSARRSIPACAGEPKLDHLTEAGEAVDPRMRGGADAAPRSVLLAMGRSPHARGSPLPRQRYRPLQRSIPACAGEPRCRPFGR